MKHLDRQWSVGVVLIIVLLGGGTSSRAQPMGGFDRHGMLAVYGIEDPAFGWTMRTMNGTFYRAAFGVPVAAWAVAGVRAWSGGEEDFGTAYRLTVSEVGTLAMVVGIKWFVRRPRPYTVLPEVTPRVHRSPFDETYDPHSFPSGHAALSFAIATSLTLSHPRWYVAVPGYVWAVSVATSRIWLGVHYPTDVLAGALLGTAVSIAVHQARSALTPEVLEADMRGAEVSLFVVRLPLGR